VAAWPDDGAAVTAAAGAGEAAGFGRCRENATTAPMTITPPAAAASRVFDSTIPTS
jgi:hypothetical protein